MIQKKSPISSARLGYEEARKQLPFEHMSAARHPRPSDNNSSYIGPAKAGKLIDKTGSAMRKWIARNRCILPGGIVKRLPSGHILIHRQRFIEWLDNLQAA